MRFSGRGAAQRSSRAPLVSAQHPVVARSPRSSTQSLDDALNAAPSSGRLRPLLATVVVVCAPKPIYALARRRNRAAKQCPRASVGLRNRGVIVFSSSLAGRWFRSTGCTPRTWKDGPGASSPRVALDGGRRSLDSRVTCRELPPTLAWPARIGACARARDNRERGSRIVGRLRGVVTQRRN